MWWKIVYERQNQTEFYWMRKENNVWGFLEKAYFTQDGGRDNNPLFVGKDTLFFYSSRLGGSICRIIRSGNQWYQPVRISLSVPVGKFLGKQFSIKKKVLSMLNSGITMLPTRMCIAGNLWMDNTEFRKNQWRHKYSLVWFYAICGIRGKNFSFLPTIAGRIR